MDTVNSPPRSNAVRAEIEQAIAAGGLGDDPAALVLRAIGSACEHLEAMTARNAAAAEEVIERTRESLLTRAEREGMIGLVADRAAHQSRIAVELIGRTLKARTVVLGCIAAAVLMLAAAGGGYWLHGGRIADAVSERVRLIEDAAFLTQIAEGNNVAALREYCAAHLTQPDVPGGWLRCALPEVLVSQMPASAPAKKAAAQ